MWEEGGKGVMHRNNTLKRAVEEVEVHEDVVEGEGDLCD